MSSVIEKFYSDNQIPQMLLKQKLLIFERNADIGEEFAYWIQNRKYKVDDALSIEGYTAEKLSKLSEYLNGEGAFMMLIELRENPKRALDQIAKGFKRK